MSATIASTVHGIIHARVSQVAADGVLPTDVPLGADGLGLDSIAIAEILLDCEQRFGVRLISLLEGPPLTLNRLVDHLTRSLQEETPA